MADLACMSADRAVITAAIETPRLRLRRLDENDVDALVKGLKSAKVSRYTAYVPHPYAASDALDFIDAALMSRTANTCHVFAIETRIGAEFVGCIELNMDDRPDNLGYWLGEGFWGQGYATEAVLAMVRFGIQHAGKPKLAAAVHPDNPASSRVLEKAGFVYDRVQTGLGGRCNDIEAKVYELISADWLAREAAKPRLLVVAVALVDRDGRVLMAMRPPAKSMAGLWEFPGGKVEDLETPEQALVRELDEELGIDVTTSCLAPITFASHAYEDFHLLMPLYVCRQWSGTVQAREGQTFQWLKPNRLNTLPMPPADIPLVAMLADIL